MTFHSLASSLVGGDTNAVGDVFIRDRQMASIDIISVATPYWGNGVSGFASISADGHFVAFSSDASNLVSSDTNAVRDIFVRERSGNTVPTYNVSGRIITSSNTGVSGITVSDGTRSAITDSNGNYTLTNIPAGSYTLTATKSGYAFNPPSRTINVSADVSGQDFVATEASIEDISLSITSLSDRYGVINPNSTTVEGNQLTVQVQIQNTGTIPVSGRIMLVNSSGRMVSDYRELTVPFGDATISFPFSSDGLVQAGQSRTDFTVFARFEFISVPLRLKESSGLGFAIEPRPVILVHGWGDTIGTWDDYTKNLLPSIGLRGFPVNEMRTGGGDSDGFGWTTKTIDENADLMRQYIDSIIGSPSSGKIRAEQVDIVAHSMGGLISRRYISKYMLSGLVRVRQLIMIATPNRGSATAELGVRALLKSPDLIKIIGGGWRFPATIELTQSSLQSFNRSNSIKNGAKFYVIAGYCGVPTSIPSIDTPCNPIEPWPSDMVVSMDSALGLDYLDGKWIEFGSLDQNRSRNPLEQQTFHSNMVHNNTMGGAIVFYGYVKPLLQGIQPSSTAEVARDNINASSSVAATTGLQYTSVQTGTVYSSQRLEFSIKSEGSDRLVLSVFGVAKQITVSLRAPDGRLIDPNTDDSNVQYMQMSADVMPLTTYAISNPIAGTWTVIVAATDQTPVTGTIVVVMGSLNSDLRFTIPEPTMNARVNTPLYVIAKLENGSTPVINANVQAELRLPGGIVAPVTLRDDGQHGDGASGDGVYGYTVNPQISGVYSAMITVSVINQGSTVDRSAVWAVAVEQILNNSVYLPLIRR